jgi:hypothetical protein
MIAQFCGSCGRYTGFKRRFGILTLLVIIFTYGAWLIAMLFYPKRCVICGNKRPFFSS